MYKNKQLIKELKPEKQSKRKVVYVKGNVVDTLETIARETGANYETVVKKAIELLDNQLKKSS